MRVRRCKECKQQFANPDSFIKHKRGIIGCRSVEGLIAAGFVLKPKGWAAFTKPESK